ncbi:hypothetical protein BBO_01205 [Beauveria brongniartii RCEF 3172]|uniref:Uncharacterized protein n=1 Tax=Beauveria brongniartii RCEF 3172 TaxID=1081107 RepID=A0A162JZK1_9HYPO|nr:hypothetical protein BBO_01205 [Beauveria brongniartii RCEF 3172]
MPGTSSYRKFWSNPYIGHPNGSLTMTLERSSNGAGDGRHYILGEQGVLEIRDVEAGFRPIIGPFYCFLEKDRAKVEEVLNTVPPPRDGSVGLWAGAILLALETKGLVKKP